MMACYGDNIKDYGVGVIDAIVNGNSLVMTLPVESSSVCLVLVHMKQYR